MSGLIVPPPDYVPPPEDVARDAELIFNRRSTEAFIDADKMVLALKRQNREAIGDGGWRRLPPTPIAPQRFRLIPQSDVMPAVTNPDGVTLTPGYVLMGNYNADLDRWDEFTFDGVDFVVTSPVRPDVRLRDNAYEIKADVARL